MQRSKVLIIEVFTRATAEELHLFSNIWTSGHSMSPVQHMQCMFSTCRGQHKNDSIMNQIVFVNMNVFFFLGLQKVWKRSVPS